MISGKNLFEFPIVETLEETSIKSLVEQVEFQKLVQANHSHIENVSGWKIHILSHQRIHYRFIHIRLTEEISESNDLFRVNKEDIFNFAVPKLLETYLNENGHKVLFI